MDELILHYGNERISCKLFYPPTLKKKIAVHIHPDGSVQVDAPSNLPTADIKRAVYKRARWIYNHRLQTLKHRSHVLHRYYVSGESHFYLGRQYVLKIIKVKKQPASVKLLRGQLQIRTRDTRPANVKRLLVQWHRKHAAVVFDKRLGTICSGIPWLKQIPEWKLLEMKKQWGSCSLNPHLVKASRECIDYVIIHELCHLKIHNHSKAYYKLLGDLMPEWKSVKSRLDGMAEIIFNT